MDNITKTPKPKTRVLWGKNFIAIKENNSINLKVITVKDSLIISYFVVIKVTTHDGVICFKKDYDLLKLNNIVKDMSNHVDMSTIFRITKWVKVKASLL